MYETLRNDLLVQLKDLPQEQLQFVMGVLDRTLSRYEIHQEKPAPSASQGELPNLVVLYLACKKTYGLTQSSLNNYETGLRVFFRTVGKPPEQVTPNDVRVFLNEYPKGRNIKIGSVDKYREYVKHFFNWAQSEGHLITNPMKSIPPLRFEKTSRKPLTQIELEYLRRACRTPRDAAIVEFLYSTGFRVSELVDTKLSDIDWTTKAVKTVGKGRKRRVSYLNAKAELAVKEYLEIRKGDSPYLFVRERKPHDQLKTAAVEKVLRKIGERSSNPSVQDATPHILRHTMATTAIQGGMPVQELSELLGHAYVDTTMVYAKNSSADIREQHRKYVV